MIVMLLTDVTNNGSNQNFPGAIQNLVVNSSNTFIKEVLQISDGNIHLHEEPGKKLNDLPKFKS